MFSDIERRLECSGCVCKKPCRCPLLIPKTYLVSDVQETLVPINMITDKANGQFYSRIKDRGAFRYGRRRNLKWRCGLYRRMKCAKTEQNDRPGFIYCALEKIDFSIESLLYNLIFDPKIVLSTS